MICGCCGSRQRGSTKPWTEIESTPDNLLEQMLELYWIGVRQELANMILTLHAWSDEGLSSVVLPDEEDLSVYGYDEFIDQVCEVPRYMARLQGMLASTKSIYVIMINSRLAHQILLCSRAIEERRDISISVREPSNARN
jgi:hypothetical protein